MIFIISGLIIFLTQLVLKENSFIMEKSLFQLLLLSIGVILVSVVISTWLTTMIPTMVLTVIMATILQIRYSTQIERDKPF